MVDLHYIKDASKAPGSQVMIRGRIRRVTDLKKAKFFWVMDVTGTIQVTMLKEKVTPELAKVLDSLAPNDFVIVEGVVPEQVKAASGLEILPISVQIVSKAMAPSPIDIEDYKKSSFDKRLDWRALDLRSPRQTAIFKIQSKLLQGMRNYFGKNNFMETFTPSLMGFTAEGGSEVFSLRHFGKTAYLRQDPQLHRQLLMLAGFDRIYEIGPSWRAELSNTPRHMTEHRTCAAEISFIKDEKEVMNVEQEVIASAIKAVVDDCSEELKLFEIELTVPKLPFPILEFPAIYELLNELGVKSVERGGDLNREAEEKMGDYVKEKYKSDFFFVNRFPFAAKPFYVMRVDDQPEWARSVDLMYKGLEMSSGGQREHRYDKIIAQANEKGLDLKNIEWFTEFFKYGAPPHGGFSIGIERLTMQVLNIPNVRETTLFPRAPERLMP